MRKSELIARLMGESKTTLFHTEKLINALGEIFINWLKDDHDEVFPLFDLGTFKKKRLPDGSMRIAYKPSPRARRELQPTRHHKKEVAA